MDPTAKQQIVERVKQANNVLVTVSNNPSVDQLAACIGITLLLNKMEKHGTAVFSGTVPSTLEFLQPEKTIEPTTDSLRDFIISLDKSKADKLRYKVEDEVVRIFITPYRSSISEKDLVFSQGDFNVDVVIALGVTNKEQIDAAITAHGRILHDATVVALNRGDTTSDVGQINWNDPAASSLSEMIVSISEAFGSNLLDGQMATAFLTGIVAETERFSNQKTTPKVMTMSAQLMAAGANQQLIASKLNPPPSEIPATDSGAKIDKPVEGGEEKKADGQLEIEHDAPKEPDEPELTEEEKSHIHIDDKGMLKTHEEMKAEQEEKKDEPEKEQSNEPSRTWLGPGEPSRSGTLTSSTKPEEYQEAINPLADNQPKPESPMPTLSHGGDSQSQDNDNHENSEQEHHDDVPPPPPPPSPEPEHFDTPPTTAEPYQPPDDNSPPPPAMDYEATPAPVDQDSHQQMQSNNETPMPADEHNEHSGETLSQLQQDSHQSEQPASNDSPQTYLDNARDAVEAAHIDMPPDNTPLANLNALPLGEPLHQETPVPLSSPEPNPHELQLPNPDGSHTSDSPDQPPSAPPVPPPLPIGPAFMNPGNDSSSPSTLPPPQPPV